MKFDLLSSFNKEWIFYSDDTREKMTLEKKREISDYIKSEYSFYHRLTRELQVKCDAIHKQLAETPVYIPDLIIPTMQTKNSDYESLCEKLSCLVDILDDYMKKYNHFEILLYTLQRV